MPRKRQTTPPPPKLTMMGKRLRQFRKALRVRIKK